MVVEIKSFLFDFAHKIKTTGAFVVNVNLDASYTAGLQYAVFTLQNVVLKMSFNR